MPMLIMPVGTVQAEEVERTNVSLKGKTNMLLKEYPIEVVDVITKECSETGKSKVKFEFSNGMIIEVEKIGKVVISSGRWGEDVKCTKTGRKIRVGEEFIEKFTKEIFPKTFDITTQQKVRPNWMEPEPPPPGGHIFDTTFSERKYRALNTNGVIGRLYLGQYGTSARNGYITSTWTNVGAWVHSDWRWRDRIVRATNAVLDDYVTVYGTTISFNIPPGAGFGIGRETAHLRIQLPNRDFIRVDYRDEPIEATGSTITGVRKGAVANFELCGTFYSIRDFFTVW